MQRAVAVLLLSLLPLLQGCIVVTLFGKSFLHTEEEADGTPEIVLELSGYGMTSSCSRVSAPPLETVMCHYGLGSIIDLDSIFSLPGILGALLQIIDPVIIQVPAGFTQTTGTWNSGGAQPLAIQAGLASIDVQPGVTLAAEPGHELVIVDFPAALSPGSQALFDLRFAKPASPGMVAAPIKVKAMFAARIEVDGKPYYLPTLPCVTSFASVPEITIPVGPGADLLSGIVTAVQQAGGSPCQGVQYAFTPTTTTTLPPTAGETCGNCLDDDGDGLVDFDDPQCCGGGSGSLALARTQFTPRKTGSRVSLGGALGKIDGFGTGPSPDVQIQVREDGGKTLWCAHVSSARLKGKKRTRRFRDGAGTLAGLQDLRLTGKKGDGSVKLAARAKQAAFQTPKAGGVGVTVGVWRAGASPDSARCLAAVETFRALKKGAVRFP